MTSTLIKGAAVAAALAVLWAFVGVERMVGDHEVGVSWEPFIKRRPSLQLRFTNPMQKGLDLVPFEELPPVDQAAFREYCGIRFGLADIQECKARAADRSL